MPCPYHRELCAFQEWSPEICEFCHAPWVKITAPATRITTRKGVNRKGEPVTIEHIAYLDGYGETPLNHLWRHATDYAFAQADAVRRASARRRGAA